ncbi:hypothetical protein Taro_039526 [Colocasia esculenta]|uniref:Uncharacterized protein n=1 Tax=Colocasia esculenta TaxID=4460 RepID=A0A843W9K0_COLES|nr:hypothetical protein [Colocasia esculenta]
MVITQSTNTKNIKAARPSEVAHGRRGRSLEIADNRSTRICLTVIERNTVGVVELDISENKRCCRSRLLNAQSHQERLLRFTGYISTTRNKLANTITVTAEMESRRNWTSIGLMRTTTKLRCLCPTVTNGFTWIQGPKGKENMKYLRQQGTYIHRISSSKCARERITNEANGGSSSAAAAAARAGRRSKGKTRTGRSQLASGIEGERIGGGDAGVFLSGAGVAGSRWIGPGVRDLRMEAMDSSSGAAAAAQAPGRGGDEQVDEDAGAMVAACGLARDAALLFQGGRFAECVEVLNQILQKKEDDPKVRKGGGLNPIYCVPLFCFSAMSSCLVIGENDVL